MGIGECVTRSDKLQIITQSIQLHVLFIILQWNAKSLIKQSFKIHAGYVYDKKVVTRLSFNYICSLNKFCHLFLKQLFFKCVI